MTTLSNARITNLTVLTGAQQPQIKITFTAALQDAAKILRDIHRVTGCDVDLTIETHQLPLPLDQAAPTQ